MPTQTKEYHKRHLDNYYPGRDLNRAPLEALPFEPVFLYLFPARLSHFLHLLLLPVTQNILLGVLHSTGGKNKNYRGPCA
jgi:hypothetical protein